MAEFKYKATMPQTGKVSQGQVTAASKGEAVAMLRDGGYIINSITEVGRTSSVLTADIGGPRKIKTESIALMCGKFAVILKSGAVRTEDAIYLIAQQTEDKRLKECLGKVFREAETGTGIADAFELACGKMLPRYFYEAVRAGAQSGNLAQSFELLNRYFERSALTQKKAKSSLRYPIFVFVVAVIVVIFVMAFVIPTLTDAFTELGGSMPWITKVLIAVSDFFAENILLILVIAAVLVAAYIIAGKTVSGRAVLDRWKLKFPMLGKIRVSSAMAMFASTLSMLMKSGMMINEALETTAGVMENVEYKKEVSEIADDVEGGILIEAAVARQEFFTDTMEGMVAIGDQSGELITMLDNVGDFYNRDTEDRIKAALAKIEPATMIFLAVIVIFIVFSIYLPIFETYTLIS